MKRYLLVFDDSMEESNLKAFVDTLDANAEMYTLDNNVCFLKTTLSSSQITDRFLPFAGSRLFFVADITSSECGGRMLGGFLDFIKQPALSAAAE